MHWKSRAAVLCAAWALAWGAGAAAPDTPQKGPPVSADAGQMAQWVRMTGDAAGRPFLIVDKKAATLYVFDPAGRLQAASPVLLGAATGDGSLPGVGERAQTGELAFEDRTTPAGRFLSHPGRNLEGESVVWIDYAAALAIHRLRPGRAHQIRASRLNASAPHERRVSLGCIVVPVAFWQDVIEPLLGQRRGVVYVLPETQSVSNLFQAP